MNDKRKKLDSYELYRIASDMLLSYSESDSIEALARVKQDTTLAITMARQSFLAHYSNRASKRSLNTIANIVFDVHLFDSIPNSEALFSTPCIM